MTKRHVQRTTHPLDSEWEFFRVFEDGVHTLTLDIPEALVLWHRLGEGLTEYEKTNYCLTCGRAPYMFVNGDCPKCNPSVGGGRVNG